MAKSLPSWALQAATPLERERVDRALQANRAVFSWPADHALRVWARQHGWPTPALGFREALTAKMMESEGAFALALRESGVTVAIPVQLHVLSAVELADFDALYAARSADGRPSAWGELVEELRVIRRAIEEGVKVTIDGRTFGDSGAFYTWAHDRYHMLEDGHDRWIGDDR